MGPGAGVNDRDPDDEPHSSDARLSFACMAQALFQRIVGVLWWMELAHHRRPWYTRLLVPVLALVLLWQMLMSPVNNYLLALNMLSPAACSALLRVQPGRPQASSSAGTYIDALSAAASVDRKRVVLAESSRVGSALTENWVKHVQTLRPAMTNILVVALDGAEHARLQEAGVNTFYDSEKSSSGLQEFFATPQKTRLVYKWKLISAAMESGLDVLYSDVDAVPLRNPLSYIDSLPRCDAYFITDSTNLYATESAWYPSGGPYLWQQLGIRFSPPWVAPNDVSSGFLYLRKNVRTRAFIDSVIVALRTSTALDVKEPEAGGAAGGVPSAHWGFDADQPVVNEVLEAMRRADPAGSHTTPTTLLSGRPGCANYGSLSFLVLSPSLFQNAQHTESMHLTDTVREPPFVRHFNSPNGGLLQKVAMMKHWGAWGLEVDTESALLCNGLVVGKA